MSIKVLSIFFFQLVFFFSSISLASERETVQHAYHLISNWQPKEALHVLKKQYGDNDSADSLSLDAHAVFAWVYFWLGDYHHANLHVEYLQLKGNIPELLEPLVHTLTITKDYQEEKSEHFVYRFQTGKDRVLVPFAKEVLEKSYESFQKSLGYEPDEPIRVEFYQSIEELARITPLTLKEILTTGTIALCQFHKIVLVSPKIFPRGYHWQSTLAHELAHFFIGKKTMNRVPVWLQEGLAKHEEDRWMTQKGNRVNIAQNYLLIRKFKEKALVPFERMHPSMAKLSSQEESSLAFAQVQDMVYLYGQKNGEYAIAQMLSQISRIHDDEYAIEKYLDTLLDTMKKIWNDDLMKRSQNTKNRNFESMNLEFSENDTKSQDNISLEGVDSENKDAIILAQMLQSKKRLKASLIVLQKQYEKRKEESPILSFELATAYLKIGDTHKAESLLKESLDYFPEFLPTLQVMARLSLEKKNYNEAEKCYKKMISLNPFDPIIYQGLVQIYQARGDIQKADEMSGLLPLLQ